MPDEIPNLTPAERALLHRFRVDDSPEPAVAARVLRSLSVAIATSGEQAATDRPPWWSWLRAGGLAVAIAACGLLVLGGTARLLTRAPTTNADAAIDAAARAPEAKAIEPATVTPAPSFVEAPAPVEPVVIDPVAEAPSAPEAEVARSRVSPKSPGKATATRSADATPIDSAAEIALFRSIKTERSADARLAAIAKYRSEFARGSFVQEVAVLEIEALCKLGRTADAASRGEAFIGKFGDSAYAAIARRGCAEANP